MRTWGWLVLVGCFHPNAARNVPCSDNGSCPDGQSCDFSQEPPTCIVGDAAVSIDAALVDAEDAPPPDAAPPDAPPVQCDAAHPCPAATPICDNNMCRGCVQDVECPDDVCIEKTGACVAAGEAIYADPAGAGGTCTQAAPCDLGGSFAMIAPGRTTIRLAPGTYNRTATLNIPTTVPLVTMSGPGAGPPPIIQIGATTVDGILVGTGATALIETIAVQGGRDGISVDGGTGTIFRVGFAMNNQHPVRVGRLRPNSLVHVEESTLAGAVTREGIHATDVAVVDIRRCDITGNFNGGVRIENNSSLTLLDSFITGNGGPTADLGGVLVTNTSTITQFSFNTVANNAFAQGGPTSGAAAGIDCGRPATAIDDSIFVNNTPVNVAPTCAPTYSLFDTVAPPGTGNIVGEPSFVSATDFHITAASAARSAGDPAATEPVDVDNEPRPQGQYDIGADEIP